MEKKISVVVFANRKDFFLSKLCIASIRYYYPDINIYLIKDKLNGNFNTRYFRSVYNVKLIKFDKNYFGWSAAKVHFIAKKDMPEGRYLSLDSDIIFIGNVIEKLEAYDGDFIVHPEMYPQPFTKTVIKHYIDPEMVRTVYKDYNYPGFFFNCGQMVVRPGKVPYELFDKAFDFKKYPFYINKDIFQLVDQAVLNAVLPMAVDKKMITIDKSEYMIGSGEFFKDDNNDDMEKFMDGSKYPYLVHYAGALRTIELHRMKGVSLLTFFHNLYESKLNPFQKSYSRLQNSVYAIKWLNRLLFVKNRMFMKLFNIQ